MSVQRERRLARRLGTLLRMTKERSDSAKAVEAETVERFDNDGNPVDIEGAPLTDEQAIQASVGETTDHSADLADDDKETNTDA